MTVDDAALDAQRRGAIGGDLVEHPSELVAIVLDEQGGEVDADERIARPVAGDERARLADAPLAVTDQESLAGVLEQQPLAPVCAGDRLVGRLGLGDVAQGRDHRVWLPLAGANQRRRGRLEPAQLAVAAADLKQHHRDGAAAATGDCIGELVRGEHPPGRRAHLDPHPGEVRGDQLLPPDLEHLQHTVGGEDHATAHRLDDDPLPDCGEQALDVRRPIGDLDAVGAVE